MTFISTYKNLEVKGNTSSESINTDVLESKEQPSIAVNGPLNCNAQIESETLKSDKIVSKNGTHHLCMPTNLDNRFLFESSDGNTELLSIQTNGDIDIPGKLTVNGSLISSTTQKPYIEIYHNTALYPLFIEHQKTYLSSNNWAKLEVHSGTYSSHGFTPHDNNNLKFTLPQGCRFKVTLTATFFTEGSSDQTFQVAFAKNNMVLNKTITYFEVLASHLGSVSTSSIVELDTNDELEVYVRSFSLISTPPNRSLHTASFQVNAVGI